MSRTEVALLVGSDARAAHPVRNAPSSSASKIAPLDDGFASPQSGRGICDCPLLNNWPPRNGAFGYHRVVALIGIAPIANGGCGWTGIRRVVVAVIIATIIGSGC